MSPLDTLSRPLRVALPKGRLLRQTLQALRLAGLQIEDDLLQDRRLIVDLSDIAREHIGSGMELLLLKNSDVPIYVEHGVADIGVAGTDTLYEANVRVFRPFTFPFGSCRIAIAARDHVQSMDDLTRKPVLRVATKYRRYARDYFAQHGIPVEIIPLSGSVELAPVLGLADAILDLVESGQTLKDNDLHIVEEIDRTRVKLIANCAIGSRRMVHVERLVTLLQNAPLQHSDSL